MPVERPRFSICMIVKMRLLISSWVRSNGSVVSSNAACLTTSALTYSWTSVLPERRMAVSSAPILSSSLSSALSAFLATSGVVGSSVSSDFLANPGFAAASAALAASSACLDKSAATIASISGVTSFGIDFESEDKPTALIMTALSAAETFFHSTAPSVIICSTNSSEMPLSVNTERYSLMTTSDCRNSSFS